MGGLDPAKIIVILIIALIVLGPDKLPRAARQLGAAWHELTKIRDKFEEEVRAAVPDLADLPRIPTSPSRAVTGYISGLISGQSGSNGSLDSSAQTGSFEADSVVYDPNGNADATSGGARGAGAGVIQGSGGGRADEGDGVWVPYLGTQAQDFTRRAPAVPSYTSGGTLPADAVFLLDEPSMN